MLSGRKSDDPFFPELGLLEERIERLLSIDPSTVSMQAMVVDLPASPAEWPVTPALLRVIPLTLIVGLVVGVGAVVARDSYEQHRRRTSS